jgi:hypothetical protein
MRALRPEAQWGIHPGSLTRCVAGPLTAGVGMGISSNTERNLWTRPHNVVRPQVPTNLEADSEYEQDNDPLQVPPRRRTADTGQSRPLTPRHPLWSQSPFATAGKPSRWCCAPPLRLPRGPILPSLGGTSPTCGRLAALRRAWRSAFWLPAAAGRTVNRGRFGRMTGLQGEVNSVVASRRRGGMQASGP